MIGSYKQFFTAVELGDCENVNFHINNGLDPMQMYRMDGKLTNPIRSALKRGDINLVNTLLNSNKVKITIQDLLHTSNNMTITRELVNKLASNLDSKECDIPEEKLSNIVKENRISKQVANYELTKLVMSRKLEVQQEEILSESDYSSKNAQSENDSITEFSSESESDSE